MILSLIWAIALVIIVVVIALLTFLSPFSDTIKRYTEMKQKLSEHRKEVELKKLSIIERNPEVFKELMMQ